MTIFSWSGKRNYNRSIECIRWFFVYVYINKSVFTVVNI
nr:MAG TPA: hypothetical protein [Crassvirales sp.]